LLNEIISPIPNYNNDPNKNRYPQNQFDQQRRQPPQRNLSQDDKLYNKGNLENMIKNKLNKYGIQKTNFNEIENFINIGLEEYLKNIIENLIKISRIRNLNLNLYSKLAEKSQVLKIQTYNSERNHLSNNNELVPFKDFSIVFTKNMKNIIENIDHYEELKSCKNRVEKISTIKNKIDQAAEIKEKDKEKLNLTNPQNQKVKTRKRDNQYMKLCKKEFEKTKLKEDKNRQKKESLNTLEFFLDKSKQKSESTFKGVDSEMTSNINENQTVNQNINIIMETNTKNSELSKNENAIEAATEEIKLTVYKSHIPNENVKSFPDIKRRITLKDLIFYLEENKKNNTQNFILHKAILKLNQSTNN